MGKLEIEALKTRRNGYIKKALLSTLAISGLLAMAVLAPNTLQLLGLIKSVRKGRFNNQVNNAFNSLLRDGLVRLEERNNKKYARLTELGECALQAEIQSAEALGFSSRKWDKRWRVVVFDIPEKRRRTRDNLRNMMCRFGFYRLQDSVWVYPHDCEEVVILMKSKVKEGISVLYFIVEKMEYDKHLREHFGIQ